MTRLDFTYTHNPDWLLTDHQRGVLAAAGLERPFGVEKEYQGFVVMIPHPFGSHVVVTGFDGEDITTFLMSGGHKVHTMVVRQRCDSPIEAVSYASCLGGWDAFCSLSRTRRDFGRCGWL